MNNHDTTPEFLDVANVLPTVAYVQDDSDYPGNILDTYDDEDDDDFEGDEVLFFDASESPSNEVLPDFK